MRGGCPLCVKVAGNLWSPLPSSDPTPDKIRVQILSPQGILRFWEWTTWEMRNLPNNSITLCLVQVTHHSDKYKNWQDPKHLLRSNDQKKPLDRCLTQSNLGLKWKGALGWNRLTKGARGPHARPQRGLTHTTSQHSSLLPPPNMVRDVVA